MSSRWKLNTRFSIRHRFAFANRPCAEGFGSTALAQVRTPVMLVHGLNDHNVPRTESEQFYIALKDVGVETELVLYPRAGHGLAETKQIVDFADRSIAWYRKHFEKRGARVSDGGR
ncbi:MAG: alpha/beta hydrolase family protein [Longimicrobiales bacterium]